MSTGIAIQKAMNASPRDRTPQLIFADWCDEHGDHRLMGGRDVPCPAAGEVCWEDAPA